MTFADSVCFRLKRFAHGWGYLATAMLSLALLAWAAWPLLRHPNQHYLASGGDGIQSYFATAYYALYDGGMRFSGMNYPYGEHISYPNMQPLIAAGIYWAQQLGLPAARYAVGITNALVLLGLWAAPVALYAVLRRFQLPVLYAALTAVCIGYLSPQVLRLGGHNSLSYPCFLPLLWYFVIRMQEEPRRWRWYGWFVVVNVLVGGVMLYFSAAASFFLLGHVAVLAWRRAPRAQLGRMAGAALLSLLVLRAWLWLTDPVTDRPENPYGLLVYVASGLGVFTPPPGPLRDMTAALWPAEAAPAEGQSYIGLVVSLILAAALAVSLQSLARSRQWCRLLRPATVPAPLGAALWASGALLIYACGYPLKWQWMAWITDHSGPMKQFRALGRFAWPFYYVAGVAAAYYLHRFWQQQRAIRPWLAGSVVALALGGWAGEAAMQWRHKASEISQSTGAEQFLDRQSSLPQLLSWAHRQPTDFQAILPLPYYNMGSDKLDFGGSPNSIFNAEHLACTTGLPLLATYVSRPSVGQMLRHVQLLSGVSIPKSLLRDFPSNKPILLLVSPAAMSPAELRIIGLATSLGVQTAEYALYELPLEVLGATNLVQERKQAAQRWPLLTQQPNGLRTTTPSGVLSESFDQSPDRRSRLGAGGAFYAAPQQFSKLYDGPLPSPADSGRYEASVWVNAKTGYGCGNLQVKLYAADGQQLDHQVADGRVTTEIDGDWVRVAVPFRRTAAAARLEVLFDSRDLLADDLLVRPLGTDVYTHVQHRGRSCLVKNTYLLDR